MPLPLARTSSEAHLYMDLHPCECGESGQSLQSSVIEAEDDLASRYSGECRSCGTFREFIFRLPDDIIMPRTGVVVYGDGGASELLDPGEWLWVADRYAQASPWDISDLDLKGLRQVRIQIASAEAAIGEVLAFLDDGEDAVAPSAFRTEKGLGIYAEEPGRFDRDRLEIVRKTYQQQLSELDDAIAAKQ